MRNIYYTAHKGRRNANGHTITRGTVYIIRRGDNTTPHGVDALQDIGEYSHMSGGAEIEQSLLSVWAKYAELDNGQYYGNWREFVNFIQL